MDDYSGLTELAGVSTIYGYNAKDLALFAHACRRAGITEKELCDFVRNTGRIIDIVMDDLRKSFANGKFEGV